jgi:hypothetical protein
LNLSCPGGSVKELYPNLPAYSPFIFCGDTNTGESGSSPVAGYVKRNPFQGVNWAIESTYIQSPDLYYLQSGFFCKREWELEKATHIPFRFRLGSLAELDAMEGKH